MDHRVYVTDGSRTPFLKACRPGPRGAQHYERTRGIDEVVRRLRTLEREHGERFAPDPGWVGMR